MAAMLLSGEVTATGLLAAYLWRHLRDSVWRASWHVKITEMTSQS